MFRLLHIAQIRNFNPVENFLAQKFEPMPTISLKKSSTLLELYRKNLTGGGGGGGVKVKHRCACVFPVNQMVWIDVAAHPRLKNSEFKVQRHKGNCFIKSFTQFMP